MTEHLHDTYIRHWDEKYGESDEGLLELRKYWLNSEEHPKIGEPIDMAIIVDYVIDGNEDEKSRLDGFELFQALLYRGVISINDRCMYTKGTFLHMFAYCQIPEIVEFLIKEGVDINDRDMYGKTPIHYAIDECVDEEWPDTENFDFKNEDCKKTVTILIDNDANLMIEDANGMYPLWDNYTMINNVPDELFDDQLFFLPQEVYNFIKNYHYTHLLKRMI